MSRVREEARSPLGITAVAPHLVSWALVMVLVLAAFAGAVAMAAAVLVVQLVVSTAPSPQGLTRAPIRAPKAVPIAAAGLVAAVATVVPAWMSGAEGTAAMSAAQVETGSLAGVGLALPVLVLAALIGQLRRPPPRTEVVAALGDVIATGVVAMLATGWLAASLSPVGRSAVLVSGVVTIIVLATVRGEQVRAVGLVWSLAASALAGIVLASLRDGNAIAGALAAVAVAGAVLIGTAVGRRWRPLPPARWTIEVVAPVALAGPVVFVAALLWAGI